MASKKESLKKKVNPKKSNKNTIHSNLSKKRKKKTTAKANSNVNSKKTEENVVALQKKGLKQKKTKEITVKEEKLKVLITKKDTIKNKKIKAKKTEVKVENTKTKETLQKNWKSIISILKKYKKIFIASILILLISVLILFKFRDTTKKIFLTFNSYSIGDSVELKDNSKWYVIKESSSEENLVKLLSEKIIDLNKDGKIDDKDKMTFDTSNSCEYNTKNDKNIGYFLDKKLIQQYEQLSNLKEIRLLNSEEYISIRKAMEFGYDWNDGNWLASSDLNTWWLETSKYNKIYVVTERGSYRLAKPSAKHFVRLVIIVDKENIK